MGDALASVCLKGRRISCATDGSGKGGSPNEGGHGEAWTTAQIVFREKTLDSTKSLKKSSLGIRLALSRVDVALAIGVSASSVDQMVKEGALPPPRKWHSRKLWLVSEIEAYLNEWPVEGEPGLSDWDVTTDGTPQASSAKLMTLGERRIVAGSEDPLLQWYEKLGFDPATMGHEDLIRLKKAADDRWIASIPGTPLGKRERKVLAQLAAQGVGVAVHHSKIKDCGPDTEDRLRARGFIETKNQTKYPDRIDSFILTDAGYAAWEELVGKG